ncbi:MAG: hypothetical protein EBZ59_01270 [Planctomycetia bacterium]|nr:hypothetical protein [Planctomycetia bacterium]
MNTPLHALPLWAGLLPLGLYLVGLGAVHLRRRPFVVSGAWDGMLLGASLLGMLVVGPLALVQPAAGRPLWSWPMLATAVALVVALCLLVSRPRMVVYNITIEQLRPLVAEVVSSLDPGARWAGESAALPARSLQVHMEGNGAMRSVNVVAVGERTSLESWGEFSRRLRQSAGRLRVRASPWGLPFTLAGLLIVAGAAWAASTTLLGRDPRPSVDEARESSPSGAPRGGEPRTPSAAVPRDRLPPDVLGPRFATR